MIYEIVILAMVAAFLGMRLYSVLGRRAEHEEEIVPGGYERGDDKQPVAQPAAAGLQEAPRNERAISGFSPAIERGLRDIAGADRRFDLIGFMEGARGAYGMVLEAFWRGDRETLRELCDDDVYQGFDAAIAEREAAGHVLENRLIRIEDVSIHAAELNGQTARIAVSFVSDIAALTRDADGNMVAGSLDDAVESRDVWTFSRRVTSNDPAWLVDETDEG
ncbi:Tim44/TimA family putative adaptor protein [Alteraurantiacibacter buctensis]|uniref:Tim44/TimA family putative adaptor protein n=1 Tax=Alteraurantiacibacter buctensis TaxID=1503981 RepID=A0A844YYI3_9SPHN|nr:Tim44/TimA family putative adaptor protein [Alteraurantiacibacter buctensis]